MEKSFVKKRMMQSVHVNSNVEGLHYQNDVESQHAVQKCIQEYKKRDVATVTKNLQRLSDRHDAEDVRALYGAGNYSIAGLYKRFCIQSSEWHSWDENRRKDNDQKFRSFVPGETTYSPNQGTVEESLVLRNVQYVLSQMWLLIATKEMQIPINSKHQVSKKHP